jgi:hypothetical protein
MRDRTAIVVPIAAVVGALGLCCAVSILPAVGVVGAIGGWSLQSWTRIGLGLVLAALGWARMVRGRAPKRSCPRPGAAASVDTATARTANGSTDTTKENYHL